MMWFYYSLFFAIWYAAQTFLTKKLIKSISPLALFYSFLFFNIPTTLALLLIVGKIPQVAGSFYLYMGIAGFLDAIAFAASYAAISRSAISLLSPISSFTPIVTTFIAALTIHEIPTPGKFLGIALIVIGAYLLNVSDIRQGILVPFKTLFTNKGVLLFLLANFIWGITPIFQKKAIFETSPQVPLFASIIGMCFVFLFLTPFAFKKAIASLREVEKNIKWFIANGVGTAFSQAAAYAAFALVFVGYATSIFRLSSLFIIILGGVFLKEQRIKERLLGAFVMLLGAILLAV